MTPERARSLVASILPGHQVYESGLDSGAADAPAQANLAAELTSPALDVLKQLYFKTATSTPPAIADDADSGIVRLMPRKTGSLPAVQQSVVFKKGEIIGSTG